MILVPANKVEKIKYFSTLLGLIFIEITNFQSKFISIYDFLGRIACLLAKENLDFAI